MTDQDYLRIFPKVIARVKYSLIDWDFNDINRAARGGARMGVFILGSCFIDHLACYYSGEESSKITYKTFVDRFLPMYDGEELYKSMRCKLVHNYSVSGKYGFTHNHNKLHLHSDSDGRTLINLRSFINELKKAADDYFLLLSTTNELKIHFAQRYKEVGILQPTQIDLPPKVN